MSAPRRPLPLVTPWNEFYWTAPASPSSAAAAPPSGVMLLRTGT